MGSSHYAHAPKAEHQTDLDNAMFIRRGTSLQERETAVLFPGHICKAEGCDKFVHDYALLLQDLSAFTKGFPEEIWMK